MSKELTTHRIGTKAVHDFNNELTIHVEEHFDSSTYVISSDSEVFASILIQSEEARDLEGATVASVLAVILDSLDECSTARAHVLKALEEVQKPVFERMARG